MSISLKESFKPILKVSKFYGILSTPLTRYKPICGYFYKIIILLSYTGEIFNHFFNVFPPIVGQYAVLQATDYIQLFFGYITTLCFYYKSVTGTKKLVKIFDRLKKIDEYFLLIEISFDYQKIPRRLKIQLISLLLSTFICGIFSDSSIFCVYLIFCNLILFSNLIHQIFLKYKKINKFLIKNKRLKVSQIYEATKCYEELNDVIKIINNLFGLTNLMSIS